MEAKTITLPPQEEPPSTTRYSAKSTTNFEKPFLWLARKARWQPRSGYAFPSPWEPTPSPHFLALQHFLTRSLQEFVAARLAAPPTASPRPGSRR